MIRVLHLTAHLGGGVGKAVSGICKNSSIDISHTVVCFEKPVKKKYIKLLKALDISVVITPSDEILIELVSTADVIQVEWWNHPALIERLIFLSFIPMRLIFWSHVSGLFNPVIPRELILSSGHFVLTSTCSLASPIVKELFNEYPGKISVISSGGDVNELSIDPKKSYSSIKAGYIGTLDFSKLHPKYLEFLASVKDKAFSVNMYGDSENIQILEQNARELNRSSLVKMYGFNENIDKLLNRFNVFAYLLNPHHFGTAENALIEAMAAGVVPVVLDNPAELNIVTHKRNGLVVRCPEDFGFAIQWLSDHPIEFQEMGRAASEDIRATYSYKKSSEKFKILYRSILEKDRVATNFRMIFGANPSEWFLACQRTKEIFKKDGSVILSANSSDYYGLIQRGKGSARHFSAFFPDDAELMQWKNSIENSIQ